MSDNQNSLPASAVQGRTVPSRLEPDTAEISRFVEAMFRHADAGSYVSLRVFNNRGGPSPAIVGRWVDSRSAVVDGTVGLARRYAQQGVVCPPIATFRVPDRATEADLVNGLVLSVECDSGPEAARAKLEGLLGPATVVVASGGEWTDPETGEVQDRLHLHWRLTEPTREPRAHAALKRARALATGLVGGDASGKPMVHPYRWPGTWNSKNPAAPRLCRIVAECEHEIELADALERLEEAAGAAGANGSGSGAGHGLNGSTGHGSGPADPGAGEARGMAELIRAVLAAEDYHAPLAALAMRYLKAGMLDPQAVETLRGIMHAVPEAERDGGDPGRWLARLADIPRAVRTARAKLGGPASAEAEPVPADSLADLVNPASLEGEEPPAREWIVADWLPIGVVTSLYGGAGFGKTLLAQQLQTATALGRKFLGLPTLPCLSLAFYCEDDTAELHRRQRAICTHYNAPLSDLKGARWQGRAGKPNVMATVDKGLLVFTEFFAFVRKAMEETGARLLILDNIAQLFAGNENARPEVTQFVNALGGIAQDFNAAVLLLGHPGKATDSQYSGSTAWDAAVRSRWLFERPKAEGVPEDAPAQDLSDLRVLRKAKANYAGIGDEIPLRWDRGAFRIEGANADANTGADAPAVSFTRAVRDAADDQTFLRCLDILAEQGRTASDAKNAGNYAPNRMAKMPESGNAGRGRLALAMQRLFNTGAIEIGYLGRRPNRKKMHGIVRRGMGLREEPDAEGEREGGVEGEGTEGEAKGATAGAPWREGEGEADAEGIANAAE